MAITVEGCTRSVREMRLRMPFHFGTTTLTELPQLLVRIELDDGDDSHDGVAAEGLSPLWFVKDPDVTFERAFEMMVETIEAAAAFALEIEAATPFDFWRRLHDRQRAWADGEYPPLLWMFGVSLLERAVIDAFCRARGTSFARAVRENTLGIELGWVYNELAGREPAAFLPVEPRRTVAVRHTVGFTDPLTTEDVATADRLDDGLPQTLAEYVKRDGLRRFKLKLSGDVAADVARLSAIESVLEGAEVADYAVTLDANEQYGDAESFRCDWATLQDELGEFFKHLLYVEQPLERGAALTEAARETLTTWPDSPPLIIDESDGELRSLQRALECGYDGTSHKNCKGVFKGIANACLVEHCRRSRGENYLVSGEDLTTTGPVGLQQDLAVVATLGLSHVERNGHHYFRGLSMLPETTQRAVLAAHGDLYRRHDRGFPTVDIADGAISLDSVVDAPFGVPGLARELTGTRLAEYDPSS